MSWLGRGATEHAGDCSAGSENGGHAEGDQVRLDAGAAGVAANGCHRCVVAVLGRCLGDLPCGEGLHGESVRLAGLLPRFAELISVEQPEDAADENQHCFVDRARYRESTERGSPAKRPRNAAVPHDDRHGPNRLADERTELSHNASTVPTRGTLVSRDAGHGGNNRLSGMRPRAAGVDANGRLPVLLYLCGVRREAVAAAGRLLRVLLVRGPPVPAKTDRLALLLLTLPHDPLLRVTPQSMCVCDGSRTSVRGTTTRPECVRRRPPFSGQNAACSVSVRSAGC